MTQSSSCFPFGNSQPVFPAAIAVQVMAHGAIPKRLGLHLKVFRKGFFFTFLKGRNELPYPLKTDVRLTTSTAPCNGILVPRPMRKTGSSPSPPLGSKNPYSYRYLGKKYFPSSTKNPFPWRFRYFRHSWDGNGTSQRFWFKG